MYNERNWRREGFTARLESAFRQAVNDGVQKLSLSFGIGDKIHFDNSTAKYIEAIQHIQHTIAPDLFFIPEISLQNGMTE